MSADPEQEHFADGIAEELLNLLSKIPELRVISRTTAFTFKGQDVPVPEVANKLNVNHVLEGSVRKSGNRVRITVQLIEAHSDTHLWSEIHDRELADVFEVQNEISQRVVADLRLKLLGEAPRARAVDPAAYVPFLKARELLLRTTDGSRSLGAIDLLEQALAVEPEWPDALYELARAYFRLDTFYPEREEYRREVRRLVALLDEVEPGGLAATSWHAWLAVQWDNDLQKAADYFELAAVRPRGAGQRLSRLARPGVRLVHRPQGGGVAQHRTPACRGANAGEFSRMAPAGRLHLLADRRRLAAVGGLRTGAALFRTEGGSGKREPRPAARAARSRPDGRVRRRV
jgi:TolB-like protein